MKENKQTQTEASYTLAELCALANLPPRTVRYYVQVGLVDRPEGETRAARYGAGQLKQLLLIQKWTAAGLSLDSIRDLLHGGEVPVPERAQRPGTVEVRSHLLVAEGIELVVEPGRAGMRPEQLRQFLAGVMKLHEELFKNPNTKED